MDASTMTLHDDGSGKTTSLPIVDGTEGEWAIDARPIRAIQRSDGSTLRVLDPGFRNTAGCVSRITFVDGDRGLLSYRGCPIEDLVANGSFLGVARRLIYDDTDPAWEERVTQEMGLPPAMASFFDGFSRGAHPMGVLVASLGAMSTCYPDLRDAPPETFAPAIARVLGQMPLLAAHAFRCFSNASPVTSDPSRGYIGNVLLGLFGTSKVTDSEIAARAIDALFILHADHEQNCSTNIVRAVASAGSDVYSGLAGGAAALYGPAHGGANEAVLRALDQIGSVARIPDYLERVKRRETRLPGFGHPVYRAYDPRARIIRDIAYAVFDDVGNDPSIDIAIELERRALADPYFTERRLYPNVDFYSGLIYRALGLPAEMMTVMFAVPRAAGWLAHWRESLADENRTITRPRQIYVGRPVAEPCDE